MQKDDPNYYPITLRRGETRPIVFTWRPRDPAEEPYDLTGKAVEMRIAPDGADEIVYSSSPGISITDAEGGEITMDLSGAMVTEYAFNHAPYVVLVDGVRLFHGTLTIKSLYA